MFYEFIILPIQFHPNLVPGYRPQQSADDRAGQASQFRPGYSASDRARGRSDRLFLPYINIMVSSSGLWCDP